MRPGYGTRHPCIDRLVADGVPLARERVSWPNGLDLVVTLYAEPPDGIEDELIMSVRCITRVDDGIVLCETPDGHHVVPGGRREPGETFHETAIREVHEETGWHVQPETIAYVGLAHVEFLNLDRVDRTLPHPDIVQLVFTGTAAERACERDAVWRDVEGWELGSRVVTRGELAAIELPDVQRALLGLLGSP